MLSTRSAIILFFSVLVAAAGGVLTVLAGSAPAAGFIAAGVGFAGAVMLFDKLINP